MDRKSFFNRLEKASKTKAAKANTKPEHDFFGLSAFLNPSSPTPTIAPDDLSNWSLDKINRKATTSLAPYSSPLTFAQANQLLNRTCYGVSFQDVASKYAGMTADTLVNLLFKDVPQPADPLDMTPGDGSPMTPGDLQTDSTKPWYNPTGAFVDGGMFNKKVDQTRSGIVMGQWNDLIISCNNSGPSIREKMVVLLSSYLVVQLGTVKDARLSYRYLRLLRSFASKNGTIPNSPNWNFKELIKQLTIEPAMLIYLNGDGSTAGSPNENYGRELQELFTIGKGPQKSTGDYTTYSEQDVQAAAHLLTGWKVAGYQDRDQIPGPNHPLGNPAVYSNPPIAAVFTAADHDQTPKKFSADYGSPVLGASASPDQASAIAEIGTLIDLIFSERATAINVMSRMYRTFVYYYIDNTATALDPNTLATVIGPLADMFIAANFDLSVPLKALLKSQHFFDNLNVGCIIKDPVSFVTIAKHNFGITGGDVIGAASSMLMQLGQPSEVAGWKGTYQDPNYHEWWISTITVDARSIFTYGINAATGGFVKGNFAAIDAIVKNNALVPQPDDPNILITSLASLFFPSGFQDITESGNTYNGPISSKELLLLKGILIPGQPDFEWKAQIYDPYIAGDPTAKQLFIDHMTDLVNYMFSMAEYYLS